jgi:hypothetical protein
MGKWFMQAHFLVYPSIKFFILPIKKKIVSPSLFCGLFKPLACIINSLKKKYLYIRTEEYLKKITDIYPVMGEYI